MFEDTMDLIYRALEQNFRHPYVLRLEDGTASSIAALLFSPSVSHGVRTTYFHVNDTGIDACVYVVQGVTNPEQAFYDALNALNYELKAVGVKADFDFYTADITLKCCITAKSSDNSVDIAVMTMLHDLEMALDVCGRYSPILFTYSNEELFGTTAVDASSESPSIDRPRYLRRTFQNRKRRRIIMAKARHQRSKKSPLAPDLPDIELGKDTT